MADNSVETPPEAVAAVDKVDIYDGDRLSGQAVVQNGAWSLLIPALEVGAHSLTATHAGAQSQPWAVEVSALEMDLSPMILSGVFVKTTWPTSGGQAPGNTATRVPTGGVPPFTYLSERSDIASVNSRGLVQGRSNGQTTITVRDSEGMQASYQVTVSNVWQLEVITFPGGLATWTVAREQIERLNGTLDPGQATRAVQSLKSVYKQPFPVNGIFWFADGEMDIPSPTADVVNANGDIQRRFASHSAHGAFSFTRAASVG